MRIVRNAAVGFALLLGILVGIVATQAIVQRRAPTDVMADYGAPFVPSPQQLFHKDRIALLLLGIDYSYNAKDIEYSTNARTDTIKAVALNFPNPKLPAGSIAILSVPRDTDYTYENGREDKINSVYTGYTDQHKAATATEAAVSRFLGMPPFDRYVTLRIDATKDLVDAIGGIDVVPDETMNYDDNWGHLHIHFVGGKKYHMNGDQAVSYSRFRHDACSDPCRIKRQDQIIRITMAKLKSDKFNDLVHITSLIDVVRKNVYTNLTQQEILSLAWSMQHVDLKTNVRTDQVPFLSDKELSCCGDVVVADDAAKAALVKKMFLDSPYPLPAPNAAAVASVVPSHVRVDVENGSGLRGQGALLAGILRKAGFVVSSVANAATFGYEDTEIDVHSATEPLAGERVRDALALKTATIRPDAKPTVAMPVTSDVTVIVGRDFASVHAERQAYR